MKPTKRHKAATETKLSDASHLFGLHAVQAALMLPATRVTEIWLADDRQDQRVTQLIDAAQQHGIQPHKIPKKSLDAMVPEGRHQGCIAKVKPLEPLSEKHLDSLLDTLTVPPFLLILDGVQDPHNLGACLRTAEAAGVHAVIAPKDRASSLTPAAVKIASGAAERVPFIQVTNLARILRDLQQHGIWLVGTAGDSETSLYQANLKGPLAVILGAEGRGIRRLTREHCDEIIFIPMQGEAESLNVSVAAGVCLYEANRQRSLLDH